MTRDPSSPLPAPDPRSYAALRHPASRIYLVAAALAMMADSVEHVISYWIVFERFRSPSLAGFAVISHWLPFLLGSMWAGALADRYDPRRIIQAGMGLFMFGSLAWGALFATGSLEKWHAVILLVVHGFAGVLWAPAGQILIHDIVGSGQLQSAIRLLATSRTLGLLLGPAVGGAMLVTIGPTAGIFVNVLIYLPLTLWLIRNPREIRRSLPQRSLTGFREMADTLRRVSGLPVVFLMSALAGIAAFFVGNAHEPQMAEFSHHLGHAGDGLHYSLLLAANAAGALAAGVVLEAGNLLPARTRTSFVLGFLWAAAIVGFAASQSFALSLALLLCAGFLDLSFNAMTRTLAQLHAPADIRGRAVGLFNVGSLGCRTFSGVLVGFGGGIVGIHWSLAASAAAMLACMLLLYRWASRRRALLDA